jgi:hypothetical protein
MKPVIPDSVYPGMYRVRWADGRLSDMTNLSRAHDALASLQETEARRLRTGAAEAARRPLMRSKVQEAA